MAKGITEAEYTNLKKHAAPGVRFSDEPASPRLRRSRPTKNRRSRRAENYKHSDFWPVALTVGGVVLIGTFLFGRQSGSMRGLGACSQTDQISGQVGNTLGTILGVPGLGSIVSSITGLFGPSAHYTPSGMLYDTAAKDLKSQATELAELQNKLYQRIGSPTRVPVPQWTYTSADDPKTGPYIAMILNNPQYAQDTSPDPLIQDQADGVYDAVIQIQSQMISAIENALDGLNSGSLVVSAGRVIPASCTIAHCANSTVMQNCGYSGGTTANQCGSSIPGQCGSQISSFLQSNSGYVLAGLGVLGLIVLLAKRR